MSHLFKGEKAPKTLLHQLITDLTWWHNRLIRRLRIDHRSFIVGSEHSGTSLLLAILDAHTDIYAVPFETSLLAQRKGKIISLLHHLDNTAWSLGKNHWVEKTPDHIHYLKELFQFCPDARVILMVRDGRDVALSIKGRRRDFEDGVNRWVLHNRAGEAYWDHPNLLKIRYEDIIIDFKQTISRVLHFIGEEYQEQVLHFHRKPKTFYSEKIEKPENTFGENHEQYRNWQINQKLFDGRGRWKREMSREEKRLFKEIAGEMLVQYGYAEGLEW